jgi:hypothetical protein
MVSLKPVSSGNELKARQKPDVLRYFVREPKTAFKFVITKPGDLAESKRSRNIVILRSGKSG